MNDKLKSKWKKWLNLIKDTMKTLSQQTQPLGHDLNLEPHKHKP